MLFSIPLLRVLYGFMRYVYSNYALCFLCKHGAAITLTTGDIEHHLAISKRPGQRVPMEMF
jgi:hypothetical protein